MHCFVILDGRFTTINGAAASTHMHYESFGRNFLEVFDSVTIVGRLFHKEEEAVLPVEGPGVQFLELPGYVGPEQFAKKMPTIVDRLRKITGPDSSYILHVPGTIPTIASLIATSRGISFGVEVVADPYDIFSPGAVSHPLRGLFRAVFVKALSWQCRRACVSTFVTRDALQRRYPPANGRPTFSFTDANLRPDTIRDRPRPAASFDCSTPTIINVGMMNREWKGQNTVINACGICVKKGLPLSLHLIGDGDLRHRLEQQVHDLGIGDHVQFVGKVSSGQAVTDHLDSADLFVLASRQEGLPRSMLEAFARGLPCIGSRVGGVPELLPESSLVNPGDAAGLADMMIEKLTNPHQLAIESELNLARARVYARQDTARQRVDFLKSVLRCSPRPDDRHSSVAADD